MAPNPGFSLHLVSQDATICPAYALEPMAVPGKTPTNLDRQTPLPTAPTDLMVNSSRKPFLTQKG